MGCTFSSDTSETDRGVEPIVPRARGNTSADGQPDDAAAVSGTSVDRRASYAKSRDVPSLRRNASHRTGSRKGPTAQAEVDGSVVLNGNPLDSPVFDATRSGKPQEHEPPTYLAARRINPERENASTSRSSRDRSSDRARAKASASQRPPRGVSSASGSPRTSTTVRRPVASPAGSKSSRAVAEAQLMFMNTISTLKASDATPRAQHGWIASDVTKDSNPFRGDEDGSVSTGPGAAGRIDLGASQSFVSFASPNLVGPETDESKKERIVASRNHSTPLVVSFNHTMQTFTFFRLPDTALCPVPHQFRDKTGTTVETQQRNAPNVFRVTEWLDTAIDYMPEDARSCFYRGSSDSHSPVVPLGQGLGNVAAFPTMPDDDNGKQSLLVAPLSVLQRASIRSELYQSAVPALFQPLTQRIRASQDVEDVDDAHLVAFPSLDPEFAVFRTYCGDNPPTSRFPSVSIPAASSPYFANPSLNDLHSAHQLPKPTLSHSGDLQSERDPATRDLKAQEHVRDTAHEPMGQNHRRSRLGDTMGGTSAAPSVVSTQAPTSAVVSPSVGTFYPRDLPSLETIRLPPRLLPTEKQ
jgi:hypothetical protein